MRGCRLSCPISAWSATSAMPSSRRLPRCASRLLAEQGEHLRHGVHLIVVRSADGSLVVGDSHHYAATPDPFAPTGVDELILDEYARGVRRSEAAACRALDRHLCVQPRPPGAGRRAGRRPAHRDHHQRHRRQHLLRHRRRGDRRSSSAEQRDSRHAACESSHLRLGRHRGRPRLACADGRVRRDLRDVRHRHHASTKRAARWAWPSGRISPRCSRCRGSRRPG